MYKIIFYIISFSILLSCSQETLKNLSTSKKEVDEYYRNGYYGLELYDLIEKSINDISSQNVTSNSAVVFDVDETVLSNYEYIAGNDFGWHQETWKHWLLKSKAEAIPQVKKLYEFLVESNISVIFLTARPELAYQATYKNLEKVGYTIFDTLICKPDKYADIDNKTFKTGERIKIKNMGYNIIATVGDQESDLEGEFTGLKIKLPNYLYEF